jgi:hypothetical protein
MVFAGRQFATSFQCAKSYQRADGKWGFMELFGYSLRDADVAIVTATLLGPVLAVQAQKWLEHGRAIKERRNTIFRTLMATRGAVLSPSHVEALNAIPVEFYGRRGKLKEINDAWKLFLDHHTGDINTDAAWMLKRQDLFLDLLHLLSQNQGYDFTRSQLSRDIYNPRAHGELEDEQTIIRKGFVKLFNGDISFPMAVTEFPATADDYTLAAQAKLQGLLLEWLEGQRAVKMEQTRPTKS